jgi:hypothetical protein
MKSKYLYLTIIRFGLRIMEAKAVPKKKKKNETFNLINIKKKKKMVFFKFLYEVVLLNFFRLLKTFRALKNSEVRFGPLEWLHTSHMHRITLGYNFPSYQ